MTIKKEPPDKYRCIKLHISSIFKQNDVNIEENMNILQNAIIRTNSITSKTYFLLRTWILKKYHDNLDIPNITEDTISMCMKSILKPSSGQKPKDNNLLLLNEFKTLHNFELEDGTNLSSVLDYYTTTMITSIENNIKLHFFDYIKRFINSYFKNLYKDEIENKDFKKQLYKELNLVKNDIINNTLTCDNKYHIWLNENRYKIVPEHFDISYHYDIKISPYKYLKNMIFMCLELEKIERKSFQFFPIQTNSIPRHIQIDTKALVELFIDTKKHQDLLNIWINDNKDKNKTKADLYTCLDENKEFIWITFFDVKQKLKNYAFDYTIITDGYTVSIRFINNNYIEFENNKKNKMRMARQALKGLTKEQKEKIREDKKFLQKEQLKIKKIENKTNENNTSKKIDDIPEFFYIDEVPKENLNGKHIFIDPGKKCLLSMIDDDGNFFSYTNRMYLKETKRLKYQALLKNHKTNIGITEIEKSLDKYNSKTCDLKKFETYLNAKIETNKKLISLYQDLKFRQYKWYSYINKKRAQDNMLNKISKKFSDTHIIIIGDWSIGKQMRNFISTPNLTLKRKLKERFKVYNIDEFRTSCLCYKTEELCENLYLKFEKDSKQKERKIHSILTYQMENKRKGCINRDKNGCKNIQKIFNNYIETGERPVRYRRDYTLQ
jgi:hypothetical protein